MCSFGIEQRLKTKVITYLTGDRLGLQTQVSADVIPKFRRHLEHRRGRIHQPVSLYERWRYKCALETGQFIT